MNATKQSLFKCLASILAVVFAITNTATAQTPVSISVGQKSPAEILIPAHFTLPETLGSIQVKFTEASDKPLVILLQDAHSVIDAQSNLQKIIEHLQRHYGVSLFALEGGAGKLDPTLFRAFPDEFVKQKIMGDYMQKGELTGSGMAAIFGREEGEFYGIEDWNLYEDNYIAYLRAMQVKEKILAGLLQAINHLDELRSKIYSNAMNKFHEKLSTFEKENGLLIEFVEYLASFDGASARMEKYPEIEKLFRSFQFEKESAKDKEGLDSSLRRMAEAFKSRYLGKMNVKQEMDFHKHYQAFVTGEMPAADFLQFLVEKGQALGVKARLTPVMLKLLGHGQTLAAIKGTRLFDELEALVREVQETLIIKSEERELAEKYRYLNLLKDLASLELTRNQWEEINTMDREMQADLQPALEFYRLALERDEAFRRNLAQLLKDHPSKTVAVLAGGFHSQGFEENLRKAGYSYIVITPNIRSLAGQETYADVMQGKNLPFKSDLKTTFYDAFAKDASMKLAAELDEPAFRKNLPLWRDNLIRQLSKEGRISEAGSYTRYIDLVWKAYYDKFGKEIFQPDARKEILRSIEAVLKDFQSDLIQAVARQFGAAPRALQTRAMMNLMDINSPRLMAVMRESPVGRVKEKIVRSEIRAEISPELGALIWDEMVHQNSQGYPEYDIKNKRRFLMFLDRESAVQSKNVNLPRKLVPLLQEISKPVILTINVSDEKEGKRLGIKSIHVLFDRKVPRGIWVYRRVMQQPVLVHPLAQVKREEVPAREPVKSPLADWIMQQLEASDEAVEIYRHGFYQVDGLSDLAKIEDEVLQKEISALFDRIAQPPGGEIVSVIAIETGLTRENLETALAQLSQSTADYETDQFVVSRSQPISMHDLDDLKEIQADNDEQSQAQRVLNNFYDTLADTELAQEVDNPFPRLILSIEPSNTQTGSNFSSITLDKPKNDVIVNASAAKNIFDEVIPSSKWKIQLQKQLNRLFTTPVDQLKKLDDKGLTWGEQGVRDFRVGGSHGLRGYYLIFGNQIVIFALLPKGFTKTTTGKQKVLDLAKAENKIREKTGEKFTKGERDSSRQLLADQLGITVISGPEAAAFTAEAQRARQQAMNDLKNQPKKHAGRRSEIRSRGQAIPDSTKHALEERRRRRQEKNNNADFLFSLIETAEGVKSSTQPNKMQKSRTEILQAINDLAEKEDIPLFKEIARLEDEIRREEEKLETPEIAALKLNLEARKDDLAEKMKERQTRGLSEEQLDEEIAIEIEKSRIQSRIESAKRKILRPSALKALDDELQIRKREQSAVREKMQKLNEELDRLPADEQFEAAAREARNEALKALSVRSEVREEVEETQEENLDRFDEGWLSREEQGLFSRIRDNRKIVEVYQKLSRGEGANPEELKLLMDSLKDENPLALILGRRLQRRDWVVNWQISGVGEGGVHDGLGVKQFNTLFGAEGYNAFKRMELDPIVTEAMESVFGIQLTRILLKDFKGIIPIVKPRSPQLSKLTPQEFRELLDKAEKQIKKNATKWLRSKLQGRGKELLEYKIDLEDGENDFEDALEADAAGLNLLSIKVGFDQVKESSNQARLEAVIHSAFARDLPGGIYSEEAYRNFIRETIALRNDLNQKDVLGPIFEDFDLPYKDSQGKLRHHSEKVIRKDVAIYLRKKIPWDGLPAEMKEVFKTVSNYRRAQVFFNRLSIQDYFIRWTLDFNEAQREAGEILEAIQYLHKKVSAKESVSGEVAATVKMIAEKFIMADSRNRSVTSRLAFHGRAPPLEGKPVYAFIDVIGLGAELGQVLTAQIGLIDQLIQQGKWEEVGNIQRNSGAPIIEKKIKMQYAIQATYDRVFGPEAEKRPLLIDVVGDEVNFVFNAEGIPADLLNTLWFEIRHAVFEATGFRIRIGIESDVSSYRDNFVGLENAEIYAHMQALRTGDYVTEIAKGIEEDIKKSVLMDDFENSIVVHRDGKYQFPVQSEAGILEYSFPEVADMMAKDQKSKLEAAHETALEKLAEFSDPEIRQIADPVASRLMMAVLNAGTEGDDKLANWFLAEELLNIVAPGPVKHETKSYVAGLIYDVLANREDMFFVYFARKLAAVLIRIGGASPESARVADFAGAIGDAVQGAFQVKELLNFDEVETGRRSYGENGRELKQFLSLGWQRNIPVMDQSAVSNWYLATRLLALRKNAERGQSSRTGSEEKRSEVREARRQVILGSKRVMSLFRGTVRDVVRTVFASDFYPQTAEILGLPESSDTVVLVDTIRGTVVWKLAELEGVVVPETGRLDALPPGFKALTPQALFLLDHPELLQRILAKLDPSIDLKMRRARVYDGAFATQPEADKIYIEEQLKRMSVAIAFQVGSENEIGDILRVPGVIPMALRDNGPLDMAKLGFGFDDVRMILDLGKQIKLQTKGAGLPEVLYLNRRAAYLRESNLYLSRLGPLSDLALSNEDVKALMRREGNAYVMTAQAFSALASIVNELAARAEVRKAYEAAA